MLTKDIKAIVTVNKTIYHVGHHTVISENPSLIVHVDEISLTMDDKWFFIEYKDVVVGAVNSRYVVDVVYGKAKKDGTG